MWQNDWTLMLRHVISDVDDPQRYTDDRLQTALLVGAQFVNNEFTLATTYNIDLSQLTLTPDPTIVGSNLATPDEWFTNLSVMKTSIIMLRNDLKLAALSAWKIKDIDVAIDLTAVANVSKELLKDVESLYDQARSQYMVGVNPQCSAILGAFNILAGGCRAPLYGYSDRDRMLF